MSRKMSRGGRAFLLAVVRGEVCALCKSAPVAAWREDVLCMPCRIKIEDEDRRNSEER